MDELESDDSWVPLPNSAALLDVDCGICQSAQSRTDPIIDA